MKFSATFYKTRKIQSRKKNIKEKWNFLIREIQILVDEMAKCNNPSFGIKALIRSMLICMAEKKD